MRHVDNEDRILSKRSIDYQEEDYPQDEVFSASEVIGNIFNENDTISALDSGKDNGEFVLENNYVERPETWLSFRYSVTNEEIWL